MKLLIENHCDVNISNSYWETALMWAAFNSQFELITLLIDNHCDVNARDILENTALI
jgi:ankyrin repeat protein